MNKKEKDAYSAIHMRVPEETEKLVSVYPHTNKYLDNLICGCEKILKNSPDGNLNIKSNGYFVVRYENGEHPRRFISRKDEHFEKYVKKFCAKRVFRAIKQKGKVFDNLDKEFREIESLFGIDTPSFCKSRETIINNWLNEPYTPNPFNRDNERNFKTRRGDLVRSKTEYIAADELFAMGIPYKMEMPIKLKNRTVYPDLTIIDPFDGCIFYIELCGMMQNPEYAKNCLIKINDYAAAGITIGKNLIMVFESSEVPFNIETFRSTVLSTMENSRKLWKMLM